MKLLTIYLVVVLSVFLNICDGAKILGVFPTMARSHYIVGSSLMKGLAEKGHEVTVISPFPQKTPLKNYRDINTPGIFEATKHFLNSILDLRTMGVAEGLVNLFDMGLYITNISLQEQSVKDLINSNEKFDLVIMEIFVNEAMLGLAHRFNAPIIAVSTFGATIWNCDMVGSPSPLSYVPSPFLSFTDHMTITQRMGNFLLAIFERFYNDYVYLPKQEQIYNQYFPNPKPSLREIRKNVSMVLLNSHFTLNYPRPYVPNMIEVGGMHVNRKIKPLPKDIKQFLDSAKNGAIYFSMGSNLKSNQLPREKIDELLKVFGSLKQKVLWKWEDKTLPGKTDNILINDWFPQDDILAHPNIRLFITHGGLLSTTEAVYHGVPVIGIPIFGDQYLNMGRATRSGYGITVEFDNLNEENLKNAINEMLSNNKYRDNMKTISERFRDQPQTPLGVAIYWVEYVIRHKGAPHMHSAGQELNFIQYHNIDLYAILVGGIWLMCFLIKALFRKLLSSLTRKPKVNQKKKKTH